MSASGRSSDLHHGPATSQLTAVLPVFLIVLMIQRHYSTLLSCLVPAPPSKLSAAGNISIGTMNV